LLVYKQLKFEGVSVNLRWHIMTEQTPVNETTAIKATPALPDAQTVTEVKHHTDRLFSFRCTRPASLRFRSGEFVMIGLMGEPHPETGKQKPLLRAPGKRLWFFATGTGFAPFASLLREPQTFEDYDEIIITHTCREVGELTYGRDLIESLKQDELLNELIGEGFWKKIKYYPTTTREQSPKMGRITDLMRSGEAFKDLGVAPLNPDSDRAMICGNLAFNLELKEMFEEYGLEEGANSKPAQYVVEKAFLDWASACGGSAPGPPKYLKPKEA